MHNKEYHGRFAPSLTGPLHVGSARTALVAWCAARHRGGRFTIRIEDLDEPRTISGMMDRHLNDLRWLGIDWDHGPDVGGPHAPYLQSQRLNDYQTSLDQLHSQRMLFPCILSRKDVRELTSKEPSPIYPAHLRPVNVSPNWYEEPQSDITIRLKTPNRQIDFVDAICGPQHQNVSTTVGDFPLKRRDGVYSYQLATSVDDLNMEITEVVRGQDLIDSTARQLLLIDLLGGLGLNYAHVPLVLNSDGKKLSKRESSMTIGALRNAGVTSEVFVGYMAWTLGWIPSPLPISAKELIQFFNWSSMSHLPDWILAQTLINPKA